MHVRLEANVAFRLFLTLFLSSIFVFGCFSSNKAKIGDSSLDASTDTPGKDGISADQIDKDALSNDTLGDATRDSQGPYQTTFTPDQEPASGPRITLVLAEAGTGYLVLKIQGSELERILGVAFHLGFDPAILEFSELSSTSFLKDSAAATANVFKETPKGRLLVGTALFRNGPDESLTGGSFMTKGDILSLRFKVLSAGTTRIDFVKGSIRIKKVDDTYIDASWTGGSLTIVAQ